MFHRFFVTLPAITRGYDRHDMLMIGGWSTYVNMAPHISHITWSLRLLRTKWLLPLALQVAFQRSAAKGPGGCPRCRMDLLLANKVYQISNQGHVWTKHAANFNSLWKIQTHTKNDGTSTCLMGKLNVDHVHWLCEITRGYIHIIYIYICTTSDASIDFHQFLVAKLGSAKKKSRHLLDSIGWFKRKS